MKKFLLVSLLCALAIPTLAEDRELTLEQRIEKLEQIIAEQNKELKKQKLDIKKNEKKLSLATQEKTKNQDDELQFHGYLRTGADGDMKHGNQTGNSKNKELLGRWGNEYDTNFNINFSKKFTQSNGAWTKLVVQLENWSDNYDNSVGDYKIDLTQLYIEMGNVPMFTGAFKDARIVAGKKKWDDQQVEILDYYYQDVNGTGLGLEDIKLWSGSLNLTYITNDFKDGDLSGSTGKKAQDVRAYKVKYTYGDISGELMYAHATNNDKVKDYIEINVEGDPDKKNKWYRDVADDGFYAGLYYQPNNFFGFEGKGQHYLQYATGLLAGMDSNSYGEGLGKIDTNANKRAASDAVAYQLGLGGTVRLGDRTHILVSYRGLRAENIDGRKEVIYSFNPESVNQRVENSWRTKKLETDALVLRPIYYINQNLDLWMEAGIARKDTKSYEGVTEDHLLYKISAGPQLKYYVGSAETSLRLFVTYIGDKTDRTKDGITTKSTVEDVITGFQVSAWW